RRLHFDPFAGKMDERLLIGGDIEVIGKDSISGSRGKLDVGLFDDFGAVLAQTADNIIDDLGRGSKDVDASVAGIVALLADLNFTNGKNAAICQNLVEHLGQDEGVDNVAAQFYLFGEHEMRERKESMKIKIKTTIKKKTG